MAPKLLATPEDDSGDRPLSPEETVNYLDRIRDGDSAALDALLVRVLPRLRRWAHGRLPRSARGMLDTGDIVLIVAAKAARQFAGLDVRRSAHLNAYLRQAISNEIASRWRTVDFDRRDTTVGDSLPDDHTSPLDRLLGNERIARFESALARLDEADRTAIVLRFELGYSFEQIATALGKPSVGAARVAVHRAVKRLTGLCDD